MIHQYSFMQAGSSMFFEDKRPARMGSDMGDEDEEASIGDDDDDEDGEDMEPEGKESAAAQDEEEELVHRRSAGVGQDGMPRPLLRL